MRNDLTDITLIVDRSGSMEACRKEAQGGIDSFIREQKNVVGEALFSLYQFDTESQEYVHKGIPIKSVWADYKLIPRGGTPLLDAVGKVINETGARLNAMAEENRPGLVIVAIVTDGEENSSKEFTKAMIKEMITHQQEVYKWQFTFLGANQDAFAEASSLGIPGSSVANFAAANSVAAYASLSSNVSRMRTASLHNEAVASSYTDDERRSMGD